MKNKKILYLIVLTFFLIFVNFASAVTNITSCQTISSQGNYTLNQTIVGASACMIIASSNVSFDCQGNTIIYGAAGAADGVGINVFYLAVPLSNITIKNCIIRDNSTLRANGHGIQFTRVTDSYIFNNTIQTNGTSTNYGIYLTVGTKRNRIENNTINTLGSSTGNYGLYLLTETSDNNFTGNSVIGNGTTTSSAVYISADANNNLIYKNNLSTFSTIAAGNNADPNTVVISASSLNNISGNRIYAEGVQRSYTVYITTNAHTNTIENNNITINLTNSGTIYGIYVLRSDGTLIQNNNLTLYSAGNTAHGMYLTNAPNTMIQNNLVINYNILRTTLSGITVSAASPYTTIQGNNFSIWGLSGVNGISITSAGSSSI